MPRTALLIGLVFAALAAPLQGQPGVERRAERNALWPNHGWTSIPWEHRLQFAADSPALAIYSARLERPGTLGDMDLPTAIWWLAESGDARYVPTFVRYSSDPKRTREFEAAVYGLARTAAHPTSRARLAVLARGNLTPEQLGHLAAVLMYVGDEPARDALRLIRPSSVGPWIRAAIPQVLASPPVEAGRWPCPEPQVFAQGADGTFRCR
jgi:hypothetical protein